MASYDDYRPTSSLNWTGDGKSITRTLHVRAADEVEALNSVDVPSRGDVIDLAQTSGDIENLYADDISIDQVAEASGDSNEKLLFEVTTTYKPLKYGGGGQTDKAAWRVTFRPEQITITNVDQDGDQEHYEPGSGGEEWWPITTGINETQDGPAGVQIDEMVEVLQIDFWKDKDDAEDYLTDVRSIQNTVNEAELSGPWGTYDAGEARITGVEVGNDADRLVTVSVEISRSLNREAIQVKLDNGDATVSVDKDGHQYLWVRWVKSADPDDENEEPKPRRIDAHVATVYQAGDFSLLGITDDILV